MNSTTLYGRFHLKRTLRGECTRYALQILDLHWSDLHRVRIEEGPDWELIVTIDHPVHGTVSVSASTFDEFKQMLDQVVQSWCEAPTTTQAA